MNRKLFSLAGALVAVFSFTVGGADVEARHCGGRQRSHCCQQTRHCGHQRNANQCCGNSGNAGYQQTSNYGLGQATYGHAGVAIDASQPAAAVQVTAPVPNN